MGLLLILRRHSSTASLKVDTEKEFIFQQDLHRARLQRAKLQCARLRAVFIAVCFALRS